MLRPGDGKRARFESRCCPRVLFRKRRFYSKRLLLGAIASEAARQLTSFSGHSHMIGQDVQVWTSALRCACAYADAPVIELAAPNSGPVQN